MPNKVKYKNARPLWGLQFIYVFKRCELFSGQPTSVNHLITLVVKYPQMELPY